MSVAIRTSVPCAKILESVRAGQIDDLRVHTSADSPQRRWTEAVVSDSGDYLWAETESDLWLSFGANNPLEIMRVLSDHMGLSFRIVS